MGGNETNEEELIRKLQDIVSTKESCIYENPAADDQRQAAVEILDAVGEFLEDWGGNNNDLADSRLGIFPCPFLRETLSNVIRTLGPGDSQWREHLWTMLEETESLVGEARDLILDFIPTSIPIASDKDTKMELFQMLHRLAEGDDSSISKVFKILSDMRRSGYFSSKEIFQFALSMLSTDSGQSNIRSVIQIMLENISNEDDAMIAVEAVRAELIILEQKKKPLLYDEAVMSTANEFLCLQEGEKYDLFFDCYVATLDEITSITNNSGQPIDSEKSYDGWMELDLFVSLMLFENSRHKKHVQTVLDDAFVNGDLMFDILIDVTALVSKQIHGRDNSGSALKLWPQRLHAFAVFLLLSPLRIADVNDAQEILGGSSRFIHELFCRSDNEGQAALASILLQTENSLTNNNNKKNSPHVQEQSKSMRQDGASNYDRIQLILQSLFEILRNNVPAEILRPHKESWLQKCTSEEMELYNFDTFRCFCRLATRCSEDEDNDEPNDLAALMVTRELLFSNLNFQSTSNENTAKCVRGLIMATELTSSRKNIVLWELVKLLLFPPTKGTIQPILGIYAMEFIRTFQDSPSGTAMQDLAGTEVQDKEMQKEIFNTLGLLLASSKIVRYSSDTSDTIPIVCTIFYENSCSLLQLEKKNQKRPKMIFSVSAFTRETVKKPSQRWVETSEWIFSLVSTYLSGCQNHSQSGKKWAPNAWVEAGLELPVVDLSRLKATGAAQERAFRLLQKAVTNTALAVEQSPWLEFAEKDFCDLLGSLKTESELAHFVEGMVRFSIALVFQLAVLAAILNGTSSRYRWHWEKQDGERSEIDESELKLLQYQFAKVCDFHRRCQFMARLFRALAFRIRNPEKKRRRHSKGVLALRPEIQTKITSASQELNLVLSSFCDKSSFLPIDAVWVCLVDSNHDKTILAALGDKDFFFTKSLTSKTTMTKLSLITEIKLCLLGHLTARVDQDSSKPCEGIDSTRLIDARTIQAHFIQCLRFCAHLSRELPSLAEKETCNAEKPFPLISLVKLTAAYFHLMFKVMVLVLDQREICPDLPSIGFFFDVYLSILSSDNPLTSSIHLDTKGETLSSTQFDRLVKPTCAHLKMCEHDAISCQLLDTLSVFASRTTGNRSFSVMAKLNRLALDSNFSFEMERAKVSSQAPYIFFHAVKQFSPSALSPARGKGPPERAVQNTLVKLAFCRSKKLEAHCFLVVGMLRQWGLLALAGEQPQGFENHLPDFVTNLKKFLAEAFETLNMKTKPRRVCNTSDDDEEYIPPQPKREIKSTAKISTISRLTTMSFPIYFEVTLQMTVAAVSIYAIVQNEDSSQMEILSKIGPFHRLENLLETFGSLADLYSSNFDVFPRNVLKKVIDVSNSMLSVTLYKLQYCIKWRNAQHTYIRNDFEARARDFGAIEFLQSLLSHVIVNVMDKLRDILGVVRSISHSPERGDSDDPTIIRPLHKMKTLKLKLEDVESQVHKIAEAHHLELTNPRSHPGIPTEKHKTKRSLTDTSGSDDVRLEGELEPTVHYDSSGDDEDDDPENYVSSRASLDDMSDSDSSASFGVNGTWGGNWDGSGFSNGTNRWKIDGKLRVTK